MDDFKKEIAEKQRLQEVLVNIRTLSEEALFLMGRMPDADEQTIAVLDRVVRILNE